MVKRIVAYFFVALCVLSLVLAFAGVEKVEFNQSYYNFLQKLSNNYNSWSFEIPNIPNIKKIDNASWSNVKELFTFFKWVGNVLIGIINGLINLVNVLVLIINVLIAVIQFILTIIYTCLDFRNIFINLSLLSY